jgi:phosphoglucomutase
VMGVGTNRINKYTLGKNTQGLSDYLKKSFPNQELKVAIAYDCRHNSNTFAKIVADVFSANGIKVYLFSDLRPTPELSFAVRHLQCNAGIVLTASHNPPEYNGYKVYWNDGGQLVPPQDGEIIKEIENLNYSDIKFESNSDLIEYIDAKVDEAFIQSTLENIDFSTPKSAKENLKIVFTSLHGTSIKLIPTVLERAGFSDVHIVQEQAEPNGNFPTVKSPNPEEPEALTMALELAEKTGADIVIGTDPDSDRLGVAVRDLNGKMVLLNGNQTMVIMTAFLLENWKRQGKITGKEFIGSTIVSTPMMLDLAEAYGVECKVGLTGFKWIAKFIKDFPQQTFIGGGEESFGFMVGDKVRDKDAVGSTLLVCEIAAQAKASGSSLYRELLNLYVDHAYYKEHLISITKKGIDGAAEIKEMMRKFRENPFDEIAGERVVMLEDYQSSVGKDFMNGEEYQINIPKSNVLIYYLEDGSKICARPSGTEPKIKFYFSVNTTLDTVEQLPEVEQYLTQKIQNIIQSMNL